MAQFFSIETGSPYIRASLVTITILAAAASFCLSLAEIEARYEGAGGTVIQDNGEPASGFRLSGLLSNAALTEAGATRRLSAGGPPEEAALLVRKALKRRPANPNSWAQLAYVESREDGPLSATANMYLERSFASAPFAGRDLRRWRIGFGYEHFDALSEPVRQALQRSLEVELLSKAGRFWFQKWAPTIQNPAGRAAAMEIAAASSG